jgi:hypothetical protein
MSKIDAQTYRTMAELEDKAAQELIDRYGTGIRPSWVSSEVALHFDRSTRYYAAAEELEAFDVN